MTNLNRSSEKRSSILFEPNEEKTVQQSPEKKLSEPIQEKLVQQSTEKKLSEPIQAQFV